MTHAVGDDAVRSVLDAYEFVEKQNGPRDRRWRIGQMEILDPADRPRFAKHGIIAAFQPWCCPQLGDPWGTMSARKDLAQVFHGVTLSSRELYSVWAVDWPVESLNPFPIIQTGATRRTGPGKDAFFPNQALTLDHMLAGYTRTMPTRSSWKNKSARWRPANWPI